MKKVIVILFSVLALMGIGTVGYLSVPFTSTEGNDFHQELKPSMQASNEFNRKIERLLENSEADSLYIIEGHKRLAQYGESDQLSNVASVRKSLISALFGIAESKGLIKLDQTLGDLKIDDTVNPLTDKEKKATVRDLLKARSGIYINAIGESKSMKEKRPERGSFRPDEFYYYNNWDFNTLGVIFEQETGMNLGEAFYEWIAVPTEMKKFQPSNVVYEKTEDTSMPMYRFYMCAEDLARFGALYANEGRWKEQQIIPEKWIEESFISYSEINDVEKFTGYGFLWWLDKQKDQTLQWAVGSGGQYIVVDRKNNLSLAVLNNTGTSPLGVFMYRTFDGNEVPYSEVRTLHRLANNQVLKK